MFESRLVVVRLTLPPPFQLFVLQCSSVVRVKDHFCTCTFSKWNMLSQRSSKCHASACGPHLNLNPKISERIYNAFFSKKKLSRSKRSAKYHKTQQKDRRKHKKPLRLYAEKGEYPQLSKQQRTTTCHPRAWAKENGALFAYYQQGAGCKWITKNSDCHPTTVLEFRNCPEDGVWQCPLKNARKASDMDVLKSNVVSILVSKPRSKP